MPIYTLLMASRSISAILWTLVSVNLITLVAGGLITWLGYSIPVRLKQIGLLPELVITAGFGSLIVACIGLGALNYSSHHALNIYGFLCTISALLLLLGLPESWYKSDHFGDGSLLIDIIYFTLLFILILLLMFAFTFAHYLRCQELALQNPPLPPLLARQDLLSAANSSYLTPNCTCELITSGCNDGHNSNHNNNHSTSILDRWNPSEQQRLTGQATLLRSRNVQTNHDHHTASQRHLSELRAPPSFANNNNVYTLKGLTCSTIHHNNNNDDRIHRHDQTFNQLEPLVHKGFYHASEAPTGSGIASRVVSMSCGRQLNEEVHQDCAASLNCQSERCTCFRPLNRSIIGAGLNEPPTNSMDDTLVHYGRFRQQQQQQHCQHTNHIAAVESPQTGRHSVAAVGRCRCHLKSASPLARGSLMGNESTHTHDKNYPKSFNLSPYNAPMLNSSTGTYSVAARGRHKVRAKGSSSVLAVTAAAAAAVFGGGVANASLLSSGGGSGCAVPDEGQFGHLTFNDDQLPDCNTMRCDIDNNDHQLSVPMLNTDTSDNFANRKMFSS